MDELQPQAAPPSRRDMLKVVTAVVCRARPADAVDPRLVQSPPGGRRFLTATEVTLLESVCEQIIPADPESGAKDAGVVNFINRQLAGLYRRFQGQYRQGLASLQQTSRKQFGKDFEQLSWDQQTALLTLLEWGRAPRELWRSSNQQQFFRLLCDHTMQGFYGSHALARRQGLSLDARVALQFPCGVDQDHVGAERPEAERDQDGEMAVLHWAGRIDSRRGRARSPRAPSSAAR